MILAKSVNLTASAKGASNHLKAKNEFVLSQEKLKDQLNEKYS